MHRIKKADAFNLKANLNNTELRILEPFTKDIASNLGGMANGTIAVTGTPDSPIAEGNG